MRQARYASAFSFKYSRRPGTPASACPARSPRRSRPSGWPGCRALLEDQQRAFNASVVGATLPVLFEKPGRHPGQIIGRSPYLQAVHAEAPQRLLGQVVPVRIEAAARNSLAGALELEAA